MRHSGFILAVVLVSALSAQVPAETALRDLKLSQFPVPIPPANSPAAPRDEASSDGAAALSRIKQSVASAVSAARPSAAREITEVKTVLASAGNISPDPADPQTRKIMDAFLRLYSRFIASSLASLSAADEREYAREFFSGFFNRNDNRPREVEILSGYLSALARHRTRRDYNYTVGTMTDGGDMALSKGGELLVLSGDYSARPGDEAAAVLAHEMAHNEKRHFMQYYVIDSVNQLLLSETGAPEAKTAAAFAKNYHKWTCEYQADEVAREFMRLSGFDPRGLAAVLGKLDQSAADLRADHPSAQLRLQRLTAAFSGE